jgi:hypothetical protein
MFKLKSMDLLIIGAVLTLAGITFTTLGTFKKNKEVIDFQNQITDLSQENVDFTKKSYEDIAKLSNENIDLTERSIGQAHNFQGEITKLTNKNFELSAELLAKSEAEFKNLAKPKVNIVNFSEPKAGTETIESVLKIKVSNTGNDDCFNVRLIMNFHNSPSVLPKRVAFTSFQIIPKGHEKEYSIPMFKSKVWGEKEIPNLDKLMPFFESYTRRENSLLIKFHFEYEWDGKTHKTEEYYAIKFIGDQTHIGQSGIPKPRILEL